MTSRPASRERRQRLVTASLVAGGFKLTRPRQLVIACLLDGRHAHTAEEICRHIASEQGARANLRSVYAVLSLLARLNLVHDYFVAGKHRFELTAGQDDHIHVLVDEDERLRTVPISPALRTALEQTAGTQGYAVKDVQIVLHVTVKKA